MLITHSTAASPCLRLAILPLLLPCWLAAQPVPLARASDSGRPVPTAGSGRVPVHTHPDIADYGWWAADRDYKASFHDGFAFYPRLGADQPENLPLRWRTVSVRAGGDELLATAEAPRHGHTDSRYEYRYTRIVEAYDLTPQGVEQTFTLAARPTSPGAIVVRGEISSALFAEPVQPRHGDIVFADAGGTDRVRYGAAWAIDARGRRTEVSTSFDGRHIELQLAAESVRDAAFPLVIDPLTSPVVTSVWSGIWGLPVDSSIGREEESSSANVMIAHARQFSANDYDLYIDLYNNDFSWVATVWSHVSAAATTRWPSIAPVGGANRWVVAFDSVDNSTYDDNAYVYVHDFGNTAWYSGTILGVANNNTGTNWITFRPKVGGQRSFTAGAYALIVFNYYSGGGWSSEVYGRLLDTGDPTTVPARPPSLIGPNVYLAGGPVPPGTKRNSPFINQENGGGDGSWIVGWTEYNGATLTDQLMIARVSPAMATSPADAGFPIGYTWERQGQLAGCDGRYLVSFTSDFDRNLHVQRVDWSETAMAPTLGPVRNVATNTSDLTNGGLAYDGLSNSHWGVVWTYGKDVGTSDVFAARVGYTGGVVERQTVYAQPSTGAQSPAIIFDPQSRSFMITYCTYELTAPLLPVYGVRFTYPANATSVPFGSGCGGTISSTTPNAGNEFFRVDLAAGRQSGTQPAVLLLGVAATYQPLAPLGMPPCTLNVAPLPVSFGTTIDASGNASMVLPLPDAPAFLGDAYFQWVFAAPTVSWARKLAATPGLRVQVR